MHTGHFHCPAWRPKPLNILAAVCGAPAASFVSLSAPADVVEGWLPKVILLLPKVIPDTFADTFSCTFTFDAFGLGDSHATHLRALDSFDIMHTGHFHCPAWRAKPLNILAAVCGAPAASFDSALLEEMKGISAAL